MRQIVRSLLITIVGLLAFGPIAEAAIVSVDVNPGIAGIQSMRTVAPGTTDIMVDIVVSGILPSDPLNGYEFDLDFLAAVLSATSVVDGGFLASPAFTVQLPPLTGPTFVDFAAASLAGFVDNSIVDPGLLASITFDAVAPGFSTLDLNSVILANGINPILPLIVNDGSITVVPIPGAALLFGTGLIGLIAIARRKALGTQK